VILSNEFLSNYGFSYTGQLGTSSNPDKINFGDAMYFMAVTLSTVGYGDFSPTGHGSRALIFCIIIIGFTVLPVLVGDLADALKSQSRYAHKAPPMKGHIIVTGSLTINNLGTVLAELLSPEHLNEEELYAMNVVILSSSEPV